MCCSLCPLVSTLGLGRSIATSQAKVRARPRPSAGGTGGGRQRGTALGLPWEKLISRCHWNLATTRVPRLPFSSFSKIKSCFMCTLTGCAERLWFAHQFFLLEAAPSCPLLDQSVEPRVGTPGVRASHERQKSIQSVDKEINQKKDLAVSHLPAPQAQGCWGSRIPEMRVSMLLQWVSFSRIPRTKPSIWHHSFIHSFPLPTSPHPASPSLWPHGSPLASQPRSSRTGVLQLLEHMTTGGAAIIITTPVCDRFLASKNYVAEGQHSGEEVADPGTRWHTAGQRLRPALSLGLAASMLDPAAPSRRASPRQTPAHA